MESPANVRGLCGRQRFGTEIYNFSENWFHIQSHRGVLLDIARVLALARTVHIVTKQCIQRRRTFLSNRHSVRLVLPEV